MSSLMECIQPYADSESELHRQSSLQSRGPASSQSFDETARAQAPALVELKTEESIISGLRKSSQWQITLQDDDQNK